MNNIFGYLLKRYSQSGKRIWVDAFLYLVTVVCVYLLLTGTQVGASATPIFIEQLGLDVHATLLTLTISTLILIMYILRRLTYLNFKITQANTDSLVGVFNRRKGTELLQAEILRANLHRIPLSIVMFDIDNFKLINDKHGHEMGDEVLKDVINVARQHSRNSDIMVRWGGEEFVIGCVSTGLEAAEKLAERIRLAISEHVFSVNENVTASFGATSYQLCEELDDTLRRVDELLYRSKRGGKNQVQCELDLDDQDIALQ